MVEVVLVDVVLVEVVADVELVEEVPVDATVAEVGAGTMITGERVVVVTEFVAGGTVGGGADVGGVVDGVVRGGVVGRETSGGGALVEDGALGAVVETVSAVLVGRVTMGWLTVGREPSPEPPEPHAATVSAPTNRHASRRDLPRCDTFM